jgi:hypothetical protein
MLKHVMSGELPYLKEHTENKEITLPELKEQLK